ncbi:hypothetical protein OUZ56_027473 [Daphnia magna]|uniref:Uncharacterized protein n=1 Tax=Daphnia magna TaxID=35525 RepID=A0ABQ9ZPW2_9CRUS|nr:hypothetical protein OUZ56_027473 [Daphnia magna]
MFSNDRLHAPIPKGPQIAGGIVSILPLPYDSRNIKRKKDLKKCFLSRDVRGQALEMQSAEIGNALSPSLAPVTTLSNDREEGRHIFECHQMTSHLK